MELFVEFGVGGHIDDAVWAWSFELAFWGQCGQGFDEVSAVDAIMRQIGGRSTGVAIRERIHGDEQSFERDRQPAQQRERDRTKEILRSTRPRTMEVLDGCTPEQLDWVDPERKLPAWATWYTLRQMGWHIANTESRYYLASLGIDPPESSEDLMHELRRSADHVERAIDALPADVIIEVQGEVWTTTKVLRRLAWHKRAELNVIQDLARKSARALGVR